MLRAASRALVPVLEATFIDAALPPVIAAPKMIFRIRAYTAERGAKKGTGSVTARTSLLSRRVCLGLRVLVRHAGRL